MASGAGFYDSNGIYKYGETDDISLFSDLLNLGMDSVSTEIGILKQPGRIVQVKTGLSGTNSVSTSSPTYVSGSGGISLSITPKAAGNIIIVTWNYLGGGRIDPGIEFRADRRIIVNGTPLVGAEEIFLGNRAAAAAIANVTYTAETIIGLHTTVGTSSITFEGQQKLALGSTSSIFNGIKRGTMTLIEVKP
jgi:hypothetical protein